MSSRWCSPLLFCLVFCLVAACGRHDSTASPTAVVPDAGAPLALDAGVSTKTELAGMLPWSESVRRAKWHDAEVAIAALPEGERNKAEVRLVRARIANEEKRWADALAFLEKLDDELPLLKDLVARSRAVAAYEVGPYEKAAEYYGARAATSQWLLAAEAWQKAGDTTRAKATCDRILAADKKPRRVEERAHVLRMNLVRLKDGDGKAIDDAKWVAITALDDEAVKDALEVLEKTNIQLRAEDHMNRAKALADAGRPDDALKAIDRAASSKNPPSTAEQCHARAEALWKARTRYPEAALAYRACAAVDPARAGEDLFLSARAFSRADRDADALPAFQSVITRFPKTRWADQAEFHVARSLVLTGKWKEAAFAFDEYVKRWPTGKERKEADRYRALAHLQAQDYKTARRLLEERVGSTTDADEQARWMNLAALAAFHDGDKLHANARWAEVARTRPLSWSSIVARKRLEDNGGQLPPAIEPAESGTGDPMAFELPPPADMLHRIGLDGDAEEALKEREGIVIAKAQGRGTEALCNAYGLVDRGKRRYRTSLGIPQQLLSTAPGPRSRWAWECSFPRPFRAHVRASEEASKLPLDLVWSVMRQESSFEPEALSPARAIGLMQLLPETAKTTAQNASIAHEEGWLTQPEHNITLGALYLRELLDKLGGNVPLAVAAYNAGPEALTRWSAHRKGESIDVFVETIPFLETRGYIVRVMGNLARYGYLERAESGVPTVTLDRK